MIYVRWQPDELAVGILGQSPRVREPPHVVLNGCGQICALGLEATEAAAKTGYPLIRLTSFGDVRREPDVAAKLAYYLGMLVWSDRRGSSWWMLAAAMFPPLRPSMVVHFACGAEEGLSTEAAAPLVRELRGLYFRGVFLWVGDELGAFALRGAPVRGEWVGQAPRRVKTDGYGCRGGITTKAPHPG